MFSQYQEDDAIMDYFKERLLSGRLLDIGAADGCLFSNSRALILNNGWEGTLVEPDPANVAVLADLYRGHPGINLVAAAVADHDGVVPLHVAVADAIHNQPTHLLSSIDMAHRQKWSVGGKVRYEVVPVPAITVESLLTLHPGPYDFVSVDAEGLSTGILLQLPLKTLGVQCLIVEHDQRQHEIVDYCRGQGLLRILASNSVNLVVTQ